MPGRGEERFDAALAVRLEHGNAIARNVSASGIYFVTDIALKEGAPLSFTLEFTDYPGGTLRVRCLARVVRTEQCDGKLGVGAAISNFEFLRAGGGSNEP